MKLNVRCCCTPTKVFGTLELPDHLNRPGVIRVPAIQRRPSTPFALTPPKEAYPVVEIELRHFYQGSHAELAIYSDDRPIEFWRSVYGFTEGGIA